MEKLFDTLTFVVLLIVMILASSCMTEPYEKKIYPIEQSLKIQETSGLKFEGPSITDGSLFNFKREQSGAYMLVVRDHFKNVISKSILDINTGDNVLSFYTNAINDGDYTVEFVDELGNVVESQKITIQISKSSQHFLDQKKYQFQLLYFLPL